jgi:hypothetical protein
MQLGGHGVKNHGDWLLGLRFGREEEQWEDDCRNRRAME